MDENVSGLKGGNFHFPKGILNLVTYTRIGKALLTRNNHGT